MPLRLELKPSPSGPGYAALSIMGWKAGTDRIEAAVQRNQDSRYLDESGNWTTHPVWHDVSVLEFSGDVLTREMGPWLVDPLVANPQYQYLFELRNEEAKDRGVLRMVGQILSSQAAGNSVQQEARSRPDNAPPVAPAKPVPVQVSPVQVAPEQPKPVIVDPDATAVVPAPVINPVTPPITPVNTGTPPPPVNPVPVKKKSKVLPLVVALLVLLPLLAGAAWYFGLLPGLGMPTPAVATATEESNPSAETAGGACGAGTMTDAEDLAFVQGCIKSAPSSEQLMAVIDAAKQAQRCNIVQRLYAHKAQSGDSKIAFAYAREYDPESFKEGGCIKSADAETAAYWYEIVVSNDPSNATAKQRLEQLTATATP